MIMAAKYHPSVCASKTCAFHFGQCDKCLSNITIHGKKAYKFINPHAIYLIGLKCSKIDSIPE